ncbi:hypothetical protein HSBAA_01920 [Vreelandella sulfidaeris]|uniref:Flagellar transcriptional regulator FlhC n=1 Tax=Vreelandella sulfidaeris TaxID=115553 RepID=A0A455TZG0_9GAMM|nr:hypothetical protein HSBAA_01920 [Halomonas sulfidaeris]
MSQKSLVDEMHQVQLAIELIELGARLQVLETETALSRTRLIKLYKEVRGMSPQRGCCLSPPIGLLPGCQMFIRRCFITYT